MATTLGWNLLDSGLFYRITAFLVKELAIDIDNEEAIETLLSKRVRITYSNAGVDATQQDWLSESMIGKNRELVLIDSQRLQRDVYWNGDNITRTIRSDVVSRNAAIVAASQRIREILKPIQRKHQVAPGLVADGRDMGTEIFPEAELKIFLEANLDMRAQRRLQQLHLPDSEFQNIRDLMEARDRTDRLREVAPAEPAEDAVRLDSSNMSVVETVDEVIRLANERNLVNASTEKR